MEQITQIAKVAHEVNRGYCISIGDTSQPKWKDCPEWQRESAINGVKAHLEADLSPEESHRLWMEEKAGFMGKLRIQTRRHTRAW